MELKLHVFLTSALDGGQLDAPITLHQRKKPQVPIG